MTNSRTEPANEPPPRHGSWICATLSLVDGRRLVMVIPGAVSGAVVACEPPPDGAPSLIVVEKDGRVRRGRIGQLFGRRA